MSKRGTRLYQIISVFLIAAVMLSAAPSLVFAQGEGGTEYETVTVGVEKKVTLVRDADGNVADKILKVTIPKAGKYTMALNSPYNNDFTDDFFVSVYRTAEGARNNNGYIDSIGTFEQNDDAKSVNVYDLKARDYYLKVHKQGFNDSHLKMSMKLSKINEDDLWVINFDENSLFAGTDDRMLEVTKITFSDSDYQEGRITFASSSNKKVASIRKEKRFNENGKKQNYYYLKLKKAGTTNLTIKYVRPNGKKAVLKRTIKVKKYPAHIKSLKVNGKKIDSSKNKYRCNVIKYKKTSANVKILLKNGWHVWDVYVNYYTKDNDYKGKDIPVKTVVKGQKISFPKKYERMDVDIYMENDSGESIFYRVHFTRSTDKIR